MYAFIDESGDHNLNLIKSDGTYDIFVLGVATIAKADYSTIDSEFKSIKREIFGSDDFIVHTWELTHPTNSKSDPRNAIMRNPEVRKNFYGRVNKLIEESPIGTIFCVVRKAAFQSKYNWPYDPYELSFENILNRVMLYSDSSDIEIIPECRSKELDLKIEGEFAKYSAAGTRFHEPEELAKRITSFGCIDKNANMSGHQIADLITSPVGRHFFGCKSRPEGNEVPFSLVKKKLHGHLALTVLP